jgi:hypothetical protein
MSKKAIFLLFILIIVAVYLFLSNKSIIGNDIDLVRVGMFGQKTDFGFVKVPFLKVPFLKESDTLKFLNVAVDLNNDGAIAAYEVDGQTQPEWLVQNMPVKFIDSKNSFSFFFPDKTIDDAVPATGLALRAVLSQDSIDASDWDGSAPEGTDSKDVKIKAVTFEDVGDLQSPAPDKDGNFGWFYSDGYFSFAEPALAADVEVVDEFHPNVPDINQKRNECAPTSAANSLLWLAKKLKFGDKLPSQDALIGELKTDMDWDEGIAPADFLKGKKKITERRKLPLTNHEIGNFDGTTTFDKMAEELKKGQDVEMRIQYKDADGNAAGGHWVTAVGVERLSNGAEIIYVHDPLSPGPALMQAYRLDKTDAGIRIANYPYGRAYISFAVAESYKEPEPAGTVTPPTPETPVTPEPGGETPTTPGPGTTPEPETTPEPGTTPEPEETPEPETTPEPEETSTITVAPLEFTFEHQIGFSPCPQEIGTVNISKSGSGDADTWKIQDSLPMWLSVEQSGDVPAEITLSFNCILEEYVTQEVSASLVFVLTDSEGNSVGETATVEITGYITLE